MRVFRHSQILLITLATVGQMAVGGSARAQGRLPPAPAGFILDQANVLLPERAAALSRQLQAAAAERAVWVYIVTLPSLGVPPSRQQERLVNLGDFYRRGWLGGRVGVVLLVDDESGAAMVAASEEANRRYPPLHRNMLLEEPLRLVQLESLRRNKIEMTALAVVDVISRLQDEERRHKRRDRLVDLVMGAVITGGVAMILFVHWKRRNVAPEPTGEGHSKSADSENLL